MADIEHAPLPWHVDNRAFGGCETDNKLSIWSKSGLVAMACTCHEGAVNAEDNAQFIAHAANCHAELLAACKRAAPWLGKLIGDGGHKNAVLPRDAMRTLRLVEAVIAKAESD